MPGVGGQHHAGAGLQHLRKIDGHLLLARGRVRVRRPAAGRQRPPLHRGADGLDHRFRHRLLEERIRLADLGRIAQADHRRPVRLLLAHDRQVLVVERLALHHVDEHVGAGLDHHLLIGEVDGVGVQRHLLLVRLVEDGEIGLGRELGIRAAAVVEPRLDVAESLRGQPLHGGARLGRRGDLVDHLQLVGGDAQHRIGPAVGRREARHEEQPRRRRQLPGPLVGLHLPHLLERAGAHRRGRGGAVEGAALQVVEDVGGRVIAAPATSSSPRSRCARGR